MVKLVGLGGGRYTKRNLSNNYGIINCEKENLGCFEAQVLGGDQFFFFLGVSGKVFLGVTVKRRLEGWVGLS